MGLFFRPLCWIAGHNWRTIKKNDAIWIRECKDCGKITKTILI